MALFGITTDLNYITTNFVTDTNNRLKEKNLLKNPFKGWATSITREEGKMLHIVNISPLYFNYPIFGWVLAGMMFMFNGLTWWMLPGVILGSLMIFWLSPFYIMIYKAGLRKAGYKGKTKIVKHKDIIIALCERRVKNGSTRSSQVAKTVKERKQQMVDASGD